MQQRADCSPVKNANPKLATADSRLYNFCRSAGLIAHARRTRMMPGLNKPFRLPAILSIIAATFAVYWPSLQNKFVWDDTALILRDPFIRSWRLIPEGFRHFLFTDATSSNFYRPVQRLTYTFDYALYAFQPGGYHLTSIILHAAAAVALFFLVQKLIARAGVRTPRKTTSSHGSRRWRGRCIRCIRRRSATSPDGRMCSRLCSDSAGCISAFGRWRKNRVPSRGLPRVVSSWRCSQRKAASPSC